MGSIRRKTYTKPLPDGAELFARKGETFARWKDGRGKTKTAPATTAADGSPRIVSTSRKWLAKYRNGDGLVVEVPTDCTDKTAAEQVLRELERQAERIRAGYATTAEVKAVDHQRTPIAAHFGAFVDHRKARGRCARPQETLSQLQRVADACGFSTLREVDGDAFERWLSEHGEAGMSAGRRNKYRGTWVAFCNWCIRTGRLLTNPLVTVGKADEAADCRRQRRAMTETELVQLLGVARRRPLLDTMTVRRGKNAGKPVANLRPETVARLELLGWERALTYKTLLLTGLRKGELTTLAVGQLDLDANPPYLTLDAADEKNREGNSIPLRSDLAADLRQWLNYKAKARQDAANNAQTVPFDSKHLEPTERVTLHSGDWTGLPADTLVFDVPTGLVRILDRDLVAAGIARRVKVDGKWKIDKRDERGRTIDVHALRHSFGTHLSKAGVQPRTAQAAMRHSSIDLTMNTYTDPRLLDVAGAVELLPSLPLDAGDSQSELTTAKATGTDGREASPLLPPMLPLNPENRGKLPSIPDNSTDENEPAKKRENPCISLEKQGSSGVSRKWAMSDLNQRLPPCKGGSTENEGVSTQGLMATLAAASPYASPCGAENVHAGDAESRQDDEGEGDAGKLVDLPLPDLERLADELRGVLSADDCRRLGELLTTATDAGAQVGTAAAGAAHRPGVAGGGSCQCPPKGSFLE